MPQFHLHIHCDGEVIQDHEGGEFADLRSAVREAVPPETCNTLVAVPVNETASVPSPFAATVITPE